MMMSAPLPAEKVVEPEAVLHVTFEPKFKSPAVVATVPATLMTLGAAAMTPFPKVVTSPDSFPRVTVPPFKKVVVPAIEFVVPVMDTLYPLAVVVNAVVTVKFPANDTVVPSAVSVIRRFFASTELPKDVPPDCVIVN